MGSQLFTWGWNQRGTLGHPPETKTESIPSQVKSLANVKIVQVRNLFNYKVFFFLSFIPFPCCGLL